jgi:hypothetical protein
MNILSLVSQNLDNFYQIQTKCYRNSDTVFFSLIHRTKQGLGAAGVQKGKQKRQQAFEIKKGKKNKGRPTDIAVMQ